MFNQEVYQKRRQKLIQQLGSGLILLLGNVDSPLNSADNCYRFRQDSSFLYFCGLDLPGLALTLDCDSSTVTLYGQPQSIDDIIWSGIQPTLPQLAERSGIAVAEPLDRLAAVIATAERSGRPVYYLPTCRADNKIHLSELLGKRLAAVKAESSPQLIKAVVALRSVKGDEEIAELDSAANLGYELHTTAMTMAEAGVYEWQIAGEMEALAARAGQILSFPPIVTVHGETLHNHQRHHQLQNGDLLLVDCGVESQLHYASDHTRTVPVGGNLSQQQHEIYQIVIGILQQATQLVQPGIAYRDIHLAACRMLVDGLQDLGLMHGNPEDAVAAGAHALFMPHGLGHQLGLDVHDMEDLGEDYVGYDDRYRRSSTFGLSRLRLARELKEGFVLTVEPGIYFIPKLIEQWQSEQRHTDFINYSALDAYLDFGGIRLEDDVLVTPAGRRLLGKAIPLIDGVDVPSKEK